MKSLSEGWLRGSRAYFACCLRIMWINSMLTQDHSGGDNGLETEHRPDAPFDSAMILLNAVIEILAPPYPDRLQLAT
jgi:hypothetical protein